MTSMRRRILYCLLYRVKCALAPTPLAVSSRHLAATASAATLDIEEDASGPRHLRLWDLNMPWDVWTLARSQSGAGVVTCVAFDRGGGWLAVGDAAGHAELWRADESVGATNSWRCVATKQLNGERMLAAKFIPSVGTVSVLV
jgi:hypothetical protein